MSIIESGGSQPADFFRRIETEYLSTGLKKHSPAAMEWLRNRLKMVRLNRRKLISDGQPRPKVFIGKMWMYFYEAKDADQKLPYYDKFPIVLPFRLHKDGWTGINFHYLDYHTRIRLLGALLRISNNKKYDETTRIRASWQVLRAVSDRVRIQGNEKRRAIDCCVKRYLADHVYSKLIPIDAQDWPTAVLLPVAFFHGATPNKVWLDQRKA